MDHELNDLFGQLMSDPSTVEKLGSMLSSLAAAPTPTTEDTGGRAAMMQLLPLLKGVTGGGDDREVALLRALRPYLHGGREKRVDEAIEMLRLAKLLPLITGKRGDLHGG